MTATNSARGAGALLVVGLPGLELDAESAALLAEVRPGGVILFKHNVASAEQLGELIAGVRRAAPGALLYSDSEGGRVDRLGGIVGPAPAAGALARFPAEVAGRAGRRVGESLRLFGYDVDFAPVVDLDRGLAANALDGRYLGASPEAVEERAAAFLDGLHAAGVGGCLKHFPGLGPSTGDTHFETGLVDRSADELEEDLAPFARLAAAAGMVMIAHAVYPALDPARRPASVSGPIARDLLRGRLGFEGVAVADDLGMQALEPVGDAADRAEAALDAGCDALPLCRGLADAPAVVERLEKGSLAARVRRARERLDGYRRHRASLRPDLRREALPAPGDLETVRSRLAELGREVARQVEDEVS